MSVQLNLDVNDMVHIVQKGETLYSIAKIYKTTYQKLAETNEIAEPYTIMEKQGIKVPIPRHMVKKGETLSSIAKVYGTTYQKLAEYNEISAPYSLKIGQVLNLIQVYDEVIEFLDINDEPISFVDYLLYLEHDIEVIGTTDDRGFTNKVNSNTLVKIINFDFLLKEPIMEDIGLSVAITIKEARKLTVGEIAMCRLIFKDAIKYEDVSIYHNHFITRAFGIYGTLSYPSSTAQKDYSLARPRSKAIFIHEMTHVWQYQKGFPVLIAGGEMQLHYKSGTNPYRYDLFPPQDDRGDVGTPSFRDYNMESQAELLSHYYAITTFKTQKDIELALNNKNNYNYLHEITTVGNDMGILRRIFLTKIVEEFILSPKNDHYLPRDPYILGYIRAR